MLDFRGRESASIALLLLVCQPFVDASGFLSNSSVVVTTTSIPTQSLSTVQWKYNASSFPDASVNIQIQSTGSGSAFAFACQSAQVSYLRGLEAQKNAGEIKKVYSTFVTTSTYMVLVADIYTSCNNVFRAHGAPTSSAPSYSVQTISDYTQTIWSSSFTGKQPICWVEQDDCVMLQSSFSIENSSFNTFAQSYTSPIYFTSTPIKPGCSTPMSVPPKGESQCGKCSISGDHVQLMYWPVTMVGGDVCGSPGTTVTGNYSTPRTAMFDGITMVSPSVYISFHALKATDLCGRTIGQPLSDTILALLPDQISSARGDHFGRSPFSFNYADLNGRVSSAAYCQMIKYDWLPCQTIYDDDYEPFLWIPSQVASMRPEWKSCVPGIQGVYDPPHALHTQEMLTSEIPVATKQTTVPVPGPTTRPVPVTGVTRSPKTAHQESTNDGSLDATGIPYKVHHESTETDLPQATQNPAAGIGSLLLGAQDPVSHPVVTAQTAGDDVASQDPAAGIGGLLPGSQHPTSQVDAVVQTAGNGVAAAIASALGMPQPSSQTSQRVVAGVMVSNLAAKMTVAIGGQTLDGMKPMIIVDGHTMSMDPSGNVMAGISTMIPASAIDGPLAVITDASGEKYAVVAPGVTLTVGGVAATMNGRTYSAGFSGLVVDSSMTIMYATKTSAATHLAIITTSPTASASRTEAGVLQSTTSSGGGLRFHVQIRSIGFLLFTFVLCNFMN